MKHEFKVRKVNQMASGGSYVVIYDAVISVLPKSAVSVSIETTDPADSDPEYIEVARTEILKGAEHALLPLEKGANIVVSNLVIHATDFKPWRFAQFTAKAIQELLEKS